MSSPDGPSDRPTSDGGTIQVVEEHAVASKRRSVTGRVRVRTVTEAVQQPVGVTIATDEVHVERVAIGRIVDAMPTPRTENGVMIVPVVEERIVVEKRLFLKEEVHIRRHSRDEQMTIPVPVRKQRVVVERLPTDVTHPSRSDTMSYSSSTDTHILTAFFDSRSDAERAVERIVAEGIPQDAITLVEGADPSGAGYDDTREKSFFESLGDFFLPDEDRHIYAEGLRRGGYLLTVPTTAYNRDRILDILDDEGTVDMDEREDSWRTEGWTGYSASTETGTSDRASTETWSDSLTDREASTERTLASDEWQDSARGLGTADALDDSGTIDVVEETLRVGKRDVSHGRVRVRSYVVEEQVSEDVSLRDERVTVDRRTVDRPVTDVDAAFRDRTFDLEETSEEAVVAKEARVVEEISLGKETTHHTETVTDTVRHTEVDIEDERVEPDVRDTGSV
ncbi:YsnF/AvaK domain-containing protein [Consotaella aegiceratis]|uniref:YsnF/AvaK domain-containing protein n=1 Tax=Consotaella aegiceratis TaxID=3097961 RepID=UPI002F416551